METPSPVKRKATIDLTRSDSEDEAPKRRRRVIEIESDDDEAADKPPNNTHASRRDPSWAVAELPRGSSGPVPTVPHTVFAAGRSYAITQHGRPMTFLTGTGRHRAQIIYFFRM